MTKSANLEIWPTKGILKILGEYGGASTDFTKDGERKLEESLGWLLANAIRQGVARSEGE